MMIKDSKKKLTAWPLAMMMVTSFVFALMMVMSFAFTLPGQDMPVTSAAENSFFDTRELSERESGYYSVRSEADEREIFRTARVLHTGDEYIHQDGRQFRITRIVDDVAWAEEHTATSSRVPRVREEFFGGSYAGDDSPSPAGEQTGRQSAGADGEGDGYTFDMIPVGSGEEKLIGIYHSHGAEAYVPNDGEEFIEEGGGILLVGEAFAEALQEGGFEVIHSDTTHVPHDAGAYHRSRRTVEEMLKEQPAALFDIHRDAVPEDEYLEEVNGEKMLQVLLVVGRQNQNVEANRRFATELKGASDEEYPGLVKGILMARGNYNQDMNPRMMLLEIGGHENDRQMAKESAAVFAGVVADYMGMEAGRSRQEATPGRRHTIIGGGQTASIILWMVLLVAGAGFAFVLISAGSWVEAKSRIRHFFRREFADITQGPPDKEPGSDDENQQ